jgi:hypothetical protein
MLLDDDVFWQALVNTLVFIACSPLAIAAALGIALLVNSDLRAPRLPHHRLPVLPADDRWRSASSGAGSMTSAAASSTTCCARRHRRPAGEVPAELRLGAALRDPADFWQVLGFYMIILLTGLQSIPQHLYEAAAVDGVPAVRPLLRITLPCCGPRSSSASWSAS